MDVGKAERLWEGVEFIGIEGKNDDKWLSGVGRDGKVLTEVEKG